MKPSILLTVALGCCVSFARADTIVPGGPVSGLWTLSGSPFLIEGDIVVEIGSELFIEPGCHVNFTGHYELRVHGRLVAAGTAGDPILFYPSNPTVGWHGIRLVNTTTNGQDASTLTHCELRYGRAVGSAAEEKDGGAIHCTASADLIVSGCTFQFNYADDEGGALYLASESDIRVEDSSFLDNEAFFSGGAIHCDHSSPLILRSLLDANTSTVFAGGIAGWYDANFRLENVQVRNNQAGAVSGFYAVASAPVIAGCLFAGNTSTLGSGGGGGLTSGSLVRVINTTLADNVAAQGGGGIWVYMSSAEIVNSIVWANQPDALSVDAGSTLSVTYSDIAGGWPGTGNLDLNPEFVGTPPHPYALPALSPCVDTADPDTTGLGLPALDLAGHPRIGNGRVDMGAYEYTDAGSVSRPTLAAAPALVARCAPNPFGPQTTIEYDLTVAVPVTLRIFDLEGRPVRLMLDRVRQEPRPHRVTWDGRDESGELLPSGSYWYVLAAGDQRAMGRVTLLR